MPQIIILLEHLPISSPEKNPGIPICRGIVVDITAIGNLQRCGSIGYRLGIARNDLGNVIGIDEEAPIRPVMLKHLRGEGGFAGTVGAGDDNQLRTQRIFSIWRGQGHFCGGRQIQLRGFSE